MHYFFTYQFDLDEVGGDAAVEADEHAVAIVRHEAERQLVSARVHIGIDVVDEDAGPRVVHQVVTVRLFGTTTHNCMLTSLVVCLVRESSRLYAKQLGANKNVRPVPSSQYRPMCAVMLQSQ